MRNVFVRIFILTLSEEQNQIESEFSVNKEILTENLQQKSLES